MIDNTSSLITETLAESAEFTVTPDPFDQLEEYSKNGMEFGSPKYIAFGNAAGYQTLEYRVAELTPRFAELTFVFQKGRSSIMETLELNNLQRDSQRCAEEMAQINNSNRQYGLMLPGYVKAFEEVKMIFSRVYEEFFEISKSRYPTMSKAERQRYALGNTVLLFNLKMKVPGEDFRTSQTEN